MKRNKATYNYTIDSHGTPTPDKAAGACRWYLNCTRPANGTLAHPTLGEVPICDECRAKYHRLMGTASGLAACTGSVRVTVTDGDATATATTDLESKTVVCPKCGGKGYTTPRGASDESHTTPCGKCRMSGRVAQGVL